MSFDLRYYQREALESSAAAYQNGYLNQLLVMATATGKTLVFTHLKIRLGLTGTILILVHRDNLLDQAKQKWEEVHPQDRVGVEQAGIRTDDQPYDVIIASKDSLRGPRLERFLTDHKDRVTCIICDESHHGTSMSFKGIFERFGCIPVDQHTGKRGEGGSNVLLFGVTATPKRSDRVDLQSIFTYLVYNYPILQGMKDKYLCPTRAWQLRTGTDLSQIRTTAGDFNQGDLETAVDTPARRKAIIDEWVRIGGKTRRTIVFCTGKAQAAHSAEAYRVHAPNTFTITEETPREERRNILEQFLWAPVPTVLTNIGVATEGTDLPQADMIVIERPTKSSTLFTQMMGRGMRIFDGLKINPLTGMMDLPAKNDLIILDVVDTVRRQADLMTTPCLLGLPSNFQLQGENLLEARELMDSVLLRDPHLIAAVARMSESEFGESAPTSFEELQTSLRRILMFAPGNVRGAAEELSDLNWIVTDRRAIIEDDSLNAEQYTLKIPAPQNASSLRRTGNLDADGRPEVETVDMGERYFVLEYAHDIGRWRIRVQKIPLQRIALERERRMCIEAARSPSTPGYLIGQNWTKARAYKLAAEALPPEDTHVSNLYPDLDQSIRFVDKHVCLRHANVLQMVRVDAGWRTKEPTPTQIAICRKNHIPITDQMRRGQISDLIDNFNNMKDHIPNL